MDKNGPVVIIEDDEDDQDMLKEIFQHLAYKNEIIFFKDGNDALTYLNQTEVVPFLILSDINMPKINGFELRNRIHTNEQLQIKCIPYLFFTTSADKKRWSKLMLCQCKGSLSSQTVWKSWKTL